MDIVDLFEDKLQIENKCENYFLNLSQTNTNQNL